MAEVVWAVELGDQVFELSLTKSAEDGIFILEVSSGEGQSGQTPVSLEHIHGDKYQIRMGNRSAPVFISRTAGGYRTVLYGHEFSARVEEARIYRLKQEMAELIGGGGPTDVVSPMPGLVLSIEVEEGQGVSAGQGVAVVESMKMENEIRASEAGVVEQIVVEPGQAVDKGETLVKIVPPEQV